DTDTARDVPRTGPRTRVAATWLINATQKAIPAGLTYFFFNDAATPDIYTLSLHDALPIYSRELCDTIDASIARGQEDGRVEADRSEEHTSELQSLAYLVCRLLLEKKKPHQLCSSAENVGKDTHAAAPRAEIIAPSSSY